MSRLCAVHHSIPYLRTVTTHCTPHLLRTLPLGLPQWERQLTATFGTVSIVSNITFFCSPPGLSRGKRRLSRYSTGDNRYSPRDKPDGEHRNCVGDR